MQLMPRTAQVVAQRLGDQQLSSDLYDIENNVSLGSAYYRQLLDRYKGNRVLTLAAYNAGPNRVRGWRSDKGKNMDVYRWVESIPFRETREYVQGVLAYNVVYNALSNQTIAMLSEAERQASY
jgi:soluble lytic murein transglycosylase